MFSLGLMSGTSMDGIDAVLTKHHKSGDQTLAQVRLSYPRKLEADLRARIFHYEEKLFHPLNHLNRLHWEVGQSFAMAATKALRHAQQKRLLKKGEQRLVIGSHGQTIFHAPSAGRTWQLGETSPIVAATGITTVGDFRTADMATGGEGAPLLPWYHRRLVLSEAKKGVAVHNLGGISNFTYVGPKGQIFALDTGPANCMLDTAIQLLTRGQKNYDRGGSEARKGGIDLSLLDWLVKKPDIKKYRRLPAPKSTGRELFSHELTLQFLNRAERHKLSREDVLATLTAFAAELMGEAYQRFVLSRGLPLNKIYLAGGGTKNAALIQALTAHLPPEVEIASLHERGVDPQAVEAQAFGYFAWCSLAGQSITLPTTTGTTKPPISGKIQPGENWTLLTRIVAGKTQFLA